MKRLKSAALLIIPAAVAGLIMVFLFSQSTFKIAGATVEASVFPTKQGLTQITIPPLGEIRARTHDFPVGVALSIERVTVGQMRRLASVRFSQAEILNEAEAELADAGRRFMLRLIILAILGGLMAGLLLPGRSFKRALAAALIGLSALAMPAGIIKQQYDVKAWRQPKYSGMLTAAPWLLGTIEDKLNDLQAFRAEMRGLAKNLHEFYVKVADRDQVNLGLTTTKVLHVGDIHNNPAAFDLIAQIIRDFKVDAVIDTGDLTDLGTPMEASLVERAGALGIPYVFVPGNHDSPAVISALSKESNIKVVENQLIEVGGIKVFGVADPASSRFTAEPVGGAPAVEFARKVVAGYRALADEPEVVAVHSIDKAGALIGLAPLILTGHTHQPALELRRGTLIEDVGTTGAAGIRNFEAQDDLPYSLRLLYFSKRDQRLMAVDSLVFSGANRDFILERRLIAGKGRLKNRLQSVSFKPVEKKR